MYHRSRGRPERFKRSLSPPFPSLERRGQGPREYERRYKRSLLPSTSRGLRVYYKVKVEKDESNKVQLDSKGEPTGKYVEFFRADLVAFSKELDPRPNWEGQTQDDCNRLQERICNECIFCGEAKRLLGRL
jgi:hypothetical protein